MMNGIRCKAFSTGAVPLCLLLGILTIGCSGSKSSTPPPAANAAPVITTPPASTSTPVGTAATFTVTATGNPTVAYQWVKNGQEIVGATAASFQVANPQLVDDGTTYSVIVYNSVGTTTSPAATLHVQNTPGYFTVKFSSMAVGAGSVQGGDLIQSVAPNGSTTQVTAIPAIGASFFDWVGSDGSRTTTPNLTVSNVQSNLSFTAEFTGANVGCLATDIPGLDENGATVKVSDYKGQVILLYLDTTYDLPYPPQQQFLASLQTQFGAQGFEVVTVLTEENRLVPATLTDVQQWYSTVNANYRVQNDTSSPVGNWTGIAESVYLAATDTIPTLVVIDQNFVIQNVFLGFYDNQPGITAAVQALFPAQH
jgi:hypothetical protein